MYPRFGYNPMMSFLPMGFFLFAAAAHFILGIVVGLWVYEDAEKRRVDNPAIWTVGTVMHWLPVLIVYLVVRSHVERRPSPLDRPLVHNENITTPPGS